MFAKKTIFIIPGYRHLPTNKAYKEIVKLLKKEGYYPIVVNLSWKSTNFLQNTEIFLKKYKKINRKKKYILGFSFGAMVGFLASTKVDVSGVILCSLSPYFKEDLKSSSLQSKILAKRIKARQVLMLYGSKEEWSLRKRVNETFDHIKHTNKYLFSIKSAEHNIGDKRYLQTIHQAARVLN